MTEPHRSWEVCGTFERTPEMLALLEGMTMIRIPRSEWENTPIQDMDRND